MLNMFKFFQSGESPEWANLRKKLKGITPEMLELLLNDVLNNDSKLQYDKGITMGDFADAIRLEQSSRK